MAKNVSQGTKDAREQSLATLSEQENMKPVPSQEDADRIRLGEKVEANEKQPDGPAAQAAAEVEEANREAQDRISGAEAPASSYKTREAKA